MGTSLLALALAVVTATPTYQELEVYRGFCGGQVRIYVPPHPDNKTLVVQISDGLEGGHSQTELPLGPGPKEDLRVFTVFDGGHINFTAFVVDKNDKVRGVAVSRSVCGSQDSGRK